ncbi:MAG: alpha-L-arabinofuranosidase C-terminal domain-containing protein [Dehalococcoidia bacterium]
MRASVRIDPYRLIGVIDPRIYGYFIEHLGRCIYTGVFDPGSPLADERGFRRDVLEAARRLRPPVLRWPGGNFVSGYRWLDGVGPGPQRPSRPELAWRTTESNQFGTNEFIDYCRALDTEPYICVNMGDGSMREAVAWVEYCNRAGGTQYADLRRRHGYESPHDVTLWGLGNEVYGEWQIGHKSASDYAEEAREWGKLLKWLDPRVQLVAAGSDRPAWNWELLTQAGRAMNYISIHFYFGPDRPAGDAYHSLLARTDAAEAAIRALWGQVQAARIETKLKKDIWIAVDEWNVWYRTTGDYGDPPLEERYDLTDALTVAGFLNVLHRNADKVRLANLAQMVNVIAPIMTKPDGVLLQSIYWPLVAVAEHRGDVALDVWSESDGFTPREGAAQSPYLDVSATLDVGTRTLYVHAVNRHRDEAAEVRLRLLDVMPQPEGALHLITAPDPSATNTFDHPDAVTLHSQPLTDLSSDCVVELPPHSAGTIELRLE